MNPTEADEQKTLVQYLRARGLPHFRVPNETYTKSMNQKRQNALLGVSSGVPDLFVVVKVSGHSKLIGIEMKRAKKSLSTTSLTQKAWIETLNLAGTPTRVCYGCGEAISFIEQQEQQLKNELARSEQN